MALTPDAIRTLGEIMLNPLVPPGVRVTAAEKILDRALGKPAQTVDVTNHKSDALDYSIGLIWSRSPTGVGWRAEASRAKRVARMPHPPYHRAK